MKMICKAVLIVYMTFRVALPLTSPSPDTFIDVTVPVVYEFEVPCFEPPKDRLRPVELKEL